MRISDWSSDVCSSDLAAQFRDGGDRGDAGDRASAQAARRLPGSGEARGADDRGWARRRRPIGRASCRERVCQYVSISVVAVYLKNTISYTTNNRLATSANTPQTSNQRTKPDDH